MNFDFRVPEGSKQKLQEIMPNFQSDVAFCGGSVIAPKAVITSARVSKHLLFFLKILKRGYPKTAHCIEDHVDVGA